MSSKPGDDPDPNRPGHPAEADRILLLALRAWGGGPSGEWSDEDSTAAESGEFGSRLWERLEPSWSHRIRDAWDHQSSARAR